MKKFILPLLAVVLVFNSCERHELKPIPDEHAIIIDSLQSVNSIAIDNNNNKWVGTDNGLYCISSDSLKAIDTVTFGKVLSLYYDENQNLLWIGTDTGLFRATVNNYQIAQTQIPDEHLSNKHINCTYTDSTSRNWFGTDLGLTMNEDEIWKNDSFRVSLTGRIFQLKCELVGINSITNWNGDLYMATEGSSMWRAKNFNDTIDAFTGATQWVSPYNGRNMTSILNVVYVDSKNQLWMGGRNGIQVHWGDSASDITTFAYYDIDLADTIVNAITEAPDGKMWVGTEKGLSIQDGSLWTTITEELPDINVSAIVFDREENYAWIGTKRGILKLRM